MILSKLFRLKYYTNNLINDHKKEDIIIPEELNKFEQNKLYFYNGSLSNPPENFPFHYGNYKEGWWWGENNGFSVKNKCLTISADGYENNSLPTLQKVRKIGYNKNSIIVPYEYIRHWGFVKKVINKNNLWKNKKNQVVYRGSLTGIEEQSRLNFVKSYYQKFNIGLVNSNFYELNKNMLNIQEMSKYKYQISIEGNDKDSGLNWKLASNSVILMRPPKFESWLMEGLLKPYVHYVPLNDDFSDFEEKLHWCKNNNKKCKIIAKNARLFVKQFLNMKKEKNIFYQIIGFYKNKFNFIT